MALSREKGRTASFFADALKVRRTKEKWEK